MPPLRVNLDAIARRVGVSRMSVSRAINGQKGISESTRLRILKVCQEMNYSLLPQISAAMRYVRSPGDVSWRGSIGLINTFDPARIVCGVHGTYGRIIEGAKAEAFRLGYGLEIFHAQEPWQQGRRLTQKLLDCGVRGIILGPHPTPKARLELDWSHFTTIAIGYSLPEPEHHRIMSDLVGGIVQVCDGLRALGYRRIALVIPEGYDQRTCHLFTSGYLGWQRRCQPGSDPLLHLWADFPAGERSLRYWLRRTRPDALVSYFPPMTLFERWGLHIPEEVGMAHLDLESTGGDFSGLYQNQGSMGAIAVHRLTAQLAAADFGIPREPTITLVRGHWVAGATTRALLPVAGEKGRRSK